MCLVNGGSISRGRSTCPDPTAARRATCKLVTNTGEDLIEQTQLCKSSAARPVGAIMLCPPCLPPVSYTLG